MSIKKNIRIFHVQTCADGMKRYRFGCMFSVVAIAVASHTCWAPVKIHTESSGIARVCRCVTLRPTPKCLIIIIIMAGIGVPTRCIRENFGVLSFNFHSTLGARRLIMPGNTHTWSSENVYVFGSRAKRKLSTI